MVWLISIALVITTAMATSAVWATVVIWQDRRRRMAGVHLEEAALLELAGPAEPATPAVPGGDAAEAGEVPLADPAAFEILQSWLDRQWEQRQR